MINVVVSPQAEAQIQTIDEWWRTHRSAATQLFAQELASAFTDLAAMPSLGRHVKHREVKDLRRVLLRSTRYHVYYVATSQSVIVLAVWSAIRGSGPDLKRVG